MAKKIFHILCYIALFFIILLLADFYKQPLFLFLLMLLVALVPVSYYVGKQVHTQLSAFLRPSSTYGISGNTITLSLGLHNLTIFPIPNATLSYEITSSFYPCSETFRCNIPIYAGNQFSFDMPVTFEKSGCYRVRLTGVQFYDYLRFFSYRKDLSIQQEIIVYPKKKTDLSFDRSAFGEGFDEFEETSAKGLVSSNVTDIREYIPGDRLQRIHWKLSEKIDKLMIKENEQTSSNQFTILVELFLPTPSSYALEHSISYAYSMAEELLNAGELFFLCYYSCHEEDFIRHMIRNKEELESAMLECFYQTPYTEENLALYMHEKTDMLKGTILHVSDKGVNDLVS